jgi:hypothetical protein
VGCRTECFDTNECHSRPIAVGATEASRTDDPADNHSGQQQHLQQQQQYKTSVARTRNIVYWLWWRTDVVRVIGARGGDRHGD